MKRVALGVSGGVDSTISALLLKQQGCEVIGLHMAKWDPSSGITCQDKRGCFGPGEPDATLSAEKACARLGIPFHVIDLRQEFEQYVLAYYRSEFLAGRTPNPCTVCNRLIKFGMLWEKAQALGIEFDFFATGHYARVRYDISLQRWQLLRATDLSKDQSYFLGLLSQAQLSRVIFPLGDMLKSETRAFATQQGLDYLNKKRESQDFLEANDPSPLFANNPSEPGEFVDSDGKVLGRHKGIIHYTIGQRKHLGVAGFAQPMHVVSIDASTNRIVLGPADRLSSNTLQADNINWVSVPPFSAPVKCLAKIRNAHQPTPCTAILNSDNTLQINFELPQQSITPGQLLALYDGDLLLAAGTIL